MYIYKAGVVGAGTMGAEIAQVITYAGLPVVLKDLDEERVQKGVERIRAIYQGRVQKGKMSPDEMARRLALLTPTTSYEPFRDVDLVIEAVVEDLEVKKQVFRELDAVCPSTAILATNTSALSITELSQATRRPDRVIGIHFFNPAHVMKLVEVIPGMSTSPETVDDVITFVEGLRKIPVKVKECPGFLVNRLLMPYLNEAALVLEEGSATMKEVDQAMQAFGMPMGPFALCDLVGLDVAERVAWILYEAYGPRMTPARILTDLVQKGRLGTRVGKGFYFYQESVSEDPELDALLQRIRSEKALQPKGFSPERLLLAMVNEAILCLQEGVASAADIDTAMLAGTGFPQDKGGPLHFADQMGLDRVLETLLRYRDELGPRFWPPYLLRQMVHAGYLGVKAGRGFFLYGGEASPSQ